MSHLSHVTPLPCYTSPGHTSPMSHLSPCHILSVHWGVFSVPSFKSEWYWYELMTANPDYVKFHNSVYGCSGVAPDQFPCNGPAFS